MATNESIPSTTNKNKERHPINQTEGQSIEEQVIVPAPVLPTITNPYSVTPQNLLHLQRTIGNYALQRYLQTMPTEQKSVVQRARRKIANNIQVADTGGYKFYGHANFYPDEGEVNVETTELPVASSGSKDDKADEGDEADNAGTASKKRGPSISVDFLKAKKPRESTDDRIRAIKLALETAAKVTDESRTHTVYCKSGKERSAFHVFAALYIIKGRTRQQAKKDVVDAVMAANIKPDLTEGIFADWFHLIPDEYKDWGSTATPAPAAATPAPAFTPPAAAVASHAPAPTERKTNG